MSIENLKNRVIELGVALGQEIEPASTRKQLEQQVAKLEKALADTGSEETDSPDDESQADDQSQIGSGTKEPPAPEPTPEPTPTSESQADDQSQIGSGTKEPPAPEPTPEPDASIELTHSGLLVTSYNGKQYQLVAGVHTLPHGLAKQLAKFGVLRNESAQQ